MSVMGVIPSVLAAFNVEAVSALIVPFLFKLIGAAALWIVGGWLIGLALRLLKRFFRQGTLDPTLANYLLSIIGVLLRVVLVVAILGFFGIETTSFAALLAGAGIAIGAAWSGMLGNFAAGVFLQLFRPISVGDYIEGGGVEGTVKEVGMFVTSITSPDNVVNILGNAKLFGDTIKNYSATPFRRYWWPNSTTALTLPITLLKEIKTVPNQVNGQDADVEVLVVSGATSCGSSLHPYQLLAGLFRHQSHDC